MLTRRDAWTPSGTVLVTGGLGAIGGHVARWLAEAGAGRVVLASRSGPAAPRARRPRRADLAGAASAVPRGRLRRRTVSRSEGWQPRFRATDAGCPGCSTRRGCWTTGCSTGSTSGGMADLSGALTAKAAGARWLDEVTAGQGTGAFVLFSSAAAVLGSPGQANYAAANAYLDALAQARRARGDAALSVAWGAWGDPGAAPVRADLKASAPRAAPRRGLAFLDPDRALNTLGQVLADDETFLAVADVDWARFSPAPAQAPLLRDLLDEIPAARAPRGPPEAGPAAGGELAAAAGLPGRSRSGQAAHVTRSGTRGGGAVLGHSVRRRRSHADRAFKDMGFDSLTAVELRNRVAALTGLALPATLVFDYPTAAVVAGWLRGQLTGQLTGVVTAIPVAARATPAVTGDPVAIVALGCRYPGGVAGPEDLWRLVAEERDAVSDLPGDRGWDVAGLYDPDPDHVGTSYTLKGAGSWTAHPSSIRVLRHQPARSTRDGSPAARAAGSVLGDDRTFRHRARIAAGQPDRGIHRRRELGIRGRARGGHRVGGVPADRRGVQRDLRSRVLRAGPGGSRGVDRYRVFLVAGRAAPGLPGASRG